MSYAVTKNRIAQWIGIILVIGVFVGAYWYFKVYGSTLNQSQNDLVTNGLIGLWSFNGDDISGTTAYDRSGSGNNGTLTSGPTVTRGKVGQALSFDGTDDYVDVVSDTSFTGAFTFSTWFYTADNSQTGIIFGEDSGTTGSTPKIGIVSGNFAVRLVNAGSSDATIAVPTAGNWHHLVVTRDSSDKVDLYVNGGAASRLFSDVAQSATYTFDTIGANGGTVSQYFDGKLDEVRMYNRALAAGEIQSLYAQGGGTKSNTSVSQPQGTGRLDSGLAGYWKLDDGSGTSATDSSTNANTGTLTSGPTWTTGQIGGAVDFDGSDDSISYANNIAFDSGDFTVASWFRLDGDAGGADGDAMIFSQRSNTAADGQVAVNFFVRNSDDKIRAQIRDNVGSLVDKTGTATVSQGSWYHGVMVKTSSALTLYLNGVNDGSTSHSLSSDFDANATIRYLGESYYASSGRGFLNGTIDEIRVYNRALSADEVGQLYRLSSPTSTDTTLKGYWSFNGQDVSGTTAYDRSGAGNTGTLTGGPTRTIGKLGQALNLDGSDDYVSVADNTALDIGDTDDLTLSGWFYRDTFTTDDTVLAKRNGIAAGDTGYIAYIDDATDQLIFEVSDGTDEYSLTSTSTFTGTGWNYYTIVWDQDSAANSEIYVNGVANGATDSGTIGNIGDLGNAVVLAVGTESDAGNPFDGKIDEVRVYKRALTAGEIKGLYDTSQADLVNSSASQPQGTGRLDSGLAGYWKLDEGSGTSATDSSTNANTGTLTNGPTWTTGQVGGAVSFDNSNDYIDLGDVPAMESQSALTISAWINPTTLENYDGIVSKYASATSDTTLNLGGTGVGTTSSLAVSIRNGSDAYGYTATGKIITSTWTHCTMVFDGSQTGNSGRLKVYINGVSEALTFVGTIPATTVANSQNLIIGKTGSASDYFSGSIDEVRIYNRALSADEVAQLYRLSTPTATDTGLKGYWSFNGQDMLSSTTAADRSGAGNTGTLTGGPTRTIGKLGQALNFDGTNDYVDSGGASSVEPGLPFSISAWVKFDTLTGNAVPIVSSADIGGNGQYAGMWLGTDSTGLLSVALGNNAGCCDAAFRRTFVTGSGVVTTGTWYHIVATVTDVNTAAIHVNGSGQSVTASGSAVSSVYPANSRFRIGAVYDANVTADKFLDGTADEVRIYNRALSAGEAASLYNQGR